MSGSFVMFLLHKYYIATHRHTRTYASHMTNRVENFYVDEQCTFYGWEAPSIDIFLI